MCIIGLFVLTKFTGFFQGNCCLQITIIEINFILQWVDRIKVSPNTDILILSTCKYVTLLGERVVADVIILRILRWGDCLGLSAWAQGNQESL